MTATTSYGGVNRVAIEEMHGLAQLGYQTDLISLVKSESGIKEHTELLAGKTPVYPVEFNFVPGRRLREACRRLFYKVGKIDIDLDGLIVHNLPSLRFTVERGMNEGIKTIFYLHDPGAYTLVDAFSLVHKNSGPKIDYYQRKWLSGISTIVVNSEMSRRLLKEQSNLESHVVYPCISSAGKLDSTQLPKTRENFFLVVHRIGHDVLFDNIYSICRTDEKLDVIIAGAVVPRKTSKIMDRFRHLKDRVRFVLNPSDSELEGLYLRARGVLHPRIETFNLVALESASFGCPFMTYRESGVSEVFEGICEMGFLDRYESSGDTWADMIEKLQSDEKAAIDLGRQQFEVASSFTRVRHARELAKYFEV